MISTGICRKGWDTKRRYYFLEEQKFCEENSWSNVIRNAFCCFCCHQWPIDYFIKLLKLCNSVALYEIIYYLPQNIILYRKYMVFDFYMYWIAKMYRFFFAMKLRLLGQLLKIWDQYFENFHHHWWKQVRLCAKQCMLKAV